MTVRLLTALAILVSPAVCAEPNPRISSIYPAAGRRGAAFEALVRGSDLEGARSVVWEGAGAEALVLGIETEPPAAGEKLEKQLVKLQVSLAAQAAGRLHFRLVTPRGVSNKIPVDVLEDPVVQESEASVLRRFPLVVNGRIARPGELDAYWIEVYPGETLTFEASSGVPGFDPSVRLYERSGSWFDPERLNELASNDEPLYFPGLSTAARLVHRFERGGQYCVKVQGFSGQGGPDSVYRLRIAPEITPPPSLRPDSPANWEERQFTRVLSEDRLQELRKRGGLPLEGAAIEVYRAARENAPPPVMTAPGMVEGRIEQPAETHHIRLKVDRPQDLAIEIETPQATMPRFNPVVRLMEPGGREIATNVYTKLNNNGLYMMKMIRAKLTVSLAAPGNYTMQIRDITTARGGSDFVYRVLVRPQIPHVGSVEVAEDRLNLEAGSSKPLTVLLDREESFGGYATVAVEGLPAGVAALTAIESPIEKPPLPNGGKLERYIARDQRMSLMLVADGGATPSGLPAVVRVVVRVVTAGRLQEAIFVKEIPLMILPRRPS